MSPRRFPATACSYLKRFQMDASKKKQNWLSENPSSQLLLLTDTPFPRLLVTYGGADAFRGSEEIDAEQFIAVKGYKAKGKRLTTYAIASLEELEPTRYPSTASNASNASSASPAGDIASPEADSAEEDGQLNLFADEDFK